MGIEWYIMNCLSIIIWGHLLCFSSLFHYNLYYYYYYYYYYYHYFYYYFNVIIIQIETVHFSQFYVKTKLWRCFVPKRGQDGRNDIICRPSGRSMTAATALMDFPFSRQQYTNSYTKDCINYCLDILQLFNWYLNIHVLMPMLLSMLCLCCLLKIKDSWFLIPDFAWYLCYIQYCHKVRDVSYSWWLLTLIGCREFEFVQNSGVSISIHSYRIVRIWIRCITFILWQHPIDNIKAVKLWKTEINLTRSL